MVKQWKALAFGLALSLAIDAAVATAIVYVFGAYDKWGEGLTFFIAIFVGAQMFAVYGGLKALIGLWLFKNEAGARLVARSLADEGFPPARSYDDADSYFDHIIEHDEYEPRLKNRAAFLKGEKAGTATGSFVRGYAVQRTWDRAIELLQRM